MARRSGRYRSSQAASWCSHDSEHVLILRLLSVERYRDRTDGNWRLSADRTGLQLWTDAEIVKSGRTEVYCRRAGQLMDRIYSRLQAGTIYGIAAYGSPEWITMVRTGKEELRSLPAACQPSGQYLCEERMELCYTHLWCDAGSEAQYRNRYVGCRSPYDRQCSDLLYIGWQRTDNGFREIYRCHQDWQALYAAYSSDPPVWQFKDHQRWNQFQQIIHETDYHVATDQQTIWVQRCNRTGRWYDW